jgi:hypothetical protein
LDLPLRSRHALLQPGSYHSDCERLLPRARSPVTDTRAQIIFNTKNQIAMDIGILLAWVFLSCITVTLVTWLYRRKDLQQYRKETGANPAAIA